MTYGQRGRTVRLTRKYDAKNLHEALTADPATLNDSILSGTIYRLQALNRDGSKTVRIQELLAEQQRRWSA
jgi:hypothetical protein